MSLFKRQVLPPRVAAVLMFGVGWSLVDLAAVPFTAADLTLRVAIAIVGIACFFLAWRLWRRGSAR
ncbi:hypothetical protein Pla175_51300 [Pirellulimonas nuda]|uniref:Uncharacterized protein n=1 Tax=Pirellulimonas nuda TaxID=2528009 RepID=A0A518DJP7_9BACT|nr:hypothetical protein [Pirellulimonas nuda]QDU91700.1 hypothetical protein Pla175_51300 [Pirellulimonas nuda]